MSKKRIGFIGYRGHASRLAGIFEGLDRCAISHFFHPEKKIDTGELPVRDKGAVAVTRRLEDLYSCDAVIISSPNHTHFHYLKKLVENYRGYIFCEKPPVSESAELDWLEALAPKDKERVYFNFNMRFSLFNDMLRTFPEKYGLEEPVAISVSVGHGLGFKKSYEASWRSRNELHKGGVFETLGIHHFDLASSIYGPPNAFFASAKTRSPYGDSIDTCHVSCSFDNGCAFNMTCSYCVPYVENMRVIYTNGILDIDARKAAVFGPRDTFDRKGFFAAPPLIYEGGIDMDSIFMDSLKNSCAFFLDSARKARPIERKYFEQSVLSNRISLKIRKG